MSDFGFVQVELPGAGPLPEGRHLVRSDDLDDVVVVRVLGTTRKGLGRRRRPAAAAPEPPLPELPLARITIIDGRPLDDPEGWLRREVKDNADARLDWAMAILARAVHANRLASADPTLTEVGAQHATVLRIGYGSGEQVADGRWQSALELPELKERRDRRAAALRPQERMAALLGGRTSALVCEPLTLRARLDLDHGRPREAALQLRIALEAALAELPRAAQGAHQIDARLGELAEARSAVGAAANAALAGPLDEETREQVEHVLGRLEAALRARSAAGIPS